MSVSSVIHHHPGTHFIKLRDDYLTLCEGNHCQALILDIMEEWTNTKQRKQQSLAIYMTYPQWITALHGLYGRNVIMTSLATLEKRGLITKTPYKLYGKDTFSYQLQIHTINDHLMNLAGSSNSCSACDEYPSQTGCVEKRTRPKEDVTTHSGVEKRTAEALKKGRNVESSSQNSSIIYPVAAIITPPPSVSTADTSTASAFSISSQDIVLTEEEMRFILAYRQQRQQHQLLNNQVVVRKPLPVAENDIPREQLQKEDRERAYALHETQRPEPQQTQRSAMSESEEETRTAKAIVQLIEGLRGSRYASSERSRELKAAFTLLNLKEAPQLSLEEIREAWEHGSDIWWRETYGDDVHVHDLIRVNKSGRRWVLAFLDHKRKEDRKRTRHIETPYVPVQETLSASPMAAETYEFLASEADAAALAAQIVCDGQLYGYDMETHVEEDEYHPGIWFVHVEWWIDGDRSKSHRVSSWRDWERYFSLQQRILQYHTVSA